MDGAPSEYSFTDIRALLGQFMFKGDDVDKKLRVLSGGMDIYIYMYIYICIYIYI
jgi:ATPase subunit of ABC transporter with duplicated ATPase domains